MKKKEIKRTKNNPYGLSFIKRIKFFIKNVWFKFIINPIQKRKDLKLKLKYDKLVKENFEKMFKTDLSEVKNIMYFNPNNKTNNTELNQFLFEGRQHMLESNCIVKSPLLYEPEICDIHNEHLNNPNLVSYAYLIKKESEATKALLKEQSKTADTKYVNTTNKTTRQFLDGLLKR